MKTLSAVLALSAALALPSFAAPAQQNETLDRYVVALALNPDNAFYEYAVVQTAHRLGVEAPSLPGSSGRRSPWQTGVYEMTTGAWAVQESLQLDRLAGNGDVVSPATVPVASVEGVSAPSIPFEQLMKGRTSVVEPLAKFVPEDCYYAHFPRVSAMRRVLSATDRWGAHLLAAYSANGRDARLREKIENQLLLPSTPAFDTLYDTVIGEVAIAGSDPFFAEGSDVTVVFGLRTPTLFAARMVAQRQSVATAGSAKVSLFHEQYRDWALDGVATPDRSVSSYTAIRGDNALVSSSLAALRRALDAADGKAPSMAAAADFKYMRAVQPYSEADEDGFLFLSDAFVRRVVGPGLKIGEARRVRCAVSLQTIGYAELMFRAERGRAPGSIDELISDKYLDVAAATCPDGGTYSLDGETPVCSVHNRLRYMTPNVERPLEKVTAEEAKAYDQFRENYKTYWRRYIDPVGIRVKGGDALDVQATILPVVENSAYSSFRSAVGPDPVGLARPQVPDAVATLDVKLPPPGKDADATRLERDMGVDGGKLIGGAIGDHVTIQIADADPRLPLDMAGVFSNQGLGGFDDYLFFAPLLATLSLPTVVEAQVKDRKALDEVLAEFRARMARESTKFDGWVRVDNYQIVQGGARTVEAVTVQLLVLQWRVFYTVVGDRFIVATDRDLLDRMAAAPITGEAPGAMRFELAPSRWKQIAPSLALSYAEDSRRACLANVGWLEALRSAYAAPPYELDAQALSHFGATFACPDGGRYVVGANGAVECALHGTRSAPRQGPRPQPGSPAAYMLERVRRIEATLSFTPDGLTTRLRIE